MTVETSVMFSTLPEELAEFGLLPFAFRNFVKFRKALPLPLKVQYLGHRINNVGSVVVEVSDGVNTLEMFVLPTFSFIFTKNHVKVNMLLTLVKLQVEDNRVKILKFTTDKDGSFAKFGNPSLLSKTD